VFAVSFIVAPRQSDQTEQSFPETKLSGESGKRREIRFEFGHRGSSFFLLALPFDQLNGGPPMAEADANIALSTFELDVRIVLRLIELKDRLPESSLFEEVEMLRELLKTHRLAESV
jgi:hypothetical protein